MLEEICGEYLDLYHSRPVRQQAMKEAGQAHEDAKTRFANSSRKGKVFAEEYDELHEAASSSEEATKKWQSDEKQLTNLGSKIKKVFGDEQFEAVVARCPSDNKMYSIELNENNGLEVKNEFY